MRFELRVTLAVGALLFVGFPTTASSSPVAKTSPHVVSLRASSMVPASSHSLPASTPSRRGRAHAATAPRLTARTRTSSSRSRATLPPAVMPAAVNHAPASIASAADATPLSHSERMGNWRSAGRGPPRASPIDALSSPFLSRSTWWDSFAAATPTSRRTQPAPQLLLAGSNTGLAPSFNELPYARSHAGPFEGTAAWTIPPSGGCS